MFKRSRAALAAAALSCAGLTVAAPSLAADLPATGSATAMLAAVTAPLLAVNVHDLAEDGDDFSTASGTTGAAPADGNSLDDLVASNGTAEPVDEDTRCLATSVYFESKGEPLSGQLAVAQTIINRAESGRFADTVCGVVRQPGQFSFLKGGALPEPRKESSAWSRAVAIARIARDGLWKQVAPAALYFHARHVSPGWGKVRVASVGNHIFFR